VTGLDVIVQRQLLDLINDLRTKLQLPIILITHDLSVIAHTCSKIAVMYAGKIVEQADVVSLYENPLHPYSRLLIESFPSIRGEKGKLSGIPGAPPGLLNPPEGCNFHPRCPSVLDICRSEEPVSMLKDVHLVACHLFR
jgi:peptide/nickel transport system ATP-binding protein